MDKLRRFAALPAEDRRLFFVALPVLVGIRIALWVVPFGRLRSTAQRVGRRHAGMTRSAPGQAERIGWSVESAARFVPKATCLTQALAGEVLLGRAGHPAEVWIGVAKSPAGKLEAHAWVEAYGRVVIGDHDLHRFTPLGPEPEMP